MDSILFLLSVIFSILNTIFIARLFFQWRGVVMSNPISQIVFKVTQPVIQIFKFVLPTVKRFNLTVLFILVIINVSSIFASSLILSAQFGLLALLFFGLSQTAKEILDFLFLSLIIQVLFTWLPNAQFHPIAQIVRTINTPILKPIQKMLPPIANIDFSPFVAGIAIQFISLLF